MAFDWDPRTIKAALTPLTWLYKKFSNFYTVSRKDLSKGVLESQKSIVLKFLHIYVKYCSVNDIIHKASFFLLT